jgi:hypothetical protein
VASYNGPERRQNSNIRSHRARLLQLRHEWETNSERSNTLQSCPKCRGASERVGYTGRFASVDYYHCRECAEVWVADRVRI